MQIAFDAKRAVQNHTGLGNYSRYIIDILCRYYPDNKYILFAPKRRENPQLEEILEKNPERTKMRFPSGVWQTCPSLWRTFGIPHELTSGGISIFHGLSNELPLNIRKATGVKSVVTLHDIIFRRLPECYHTVDRLIYDYKYRKACEAADVVIAVSERTKRDAMELWNIPEEKIKVVYQGCDKQFCQTCSGEEKERIRKKYNLPEHYILNVGSIERRKNALEIVKALPGLSSEKPHISAGIPLILVGKMTKYTEELLAYVGEHGLEYRVHILSNVVFPDLPALYQMADVFVYPSRYEGFGIPIIEALHSGVPVIATTGSCLEEAGGETSLYVAPDDVKGMCEALKNVLNNLDLRRKMIEEGRTYAGHFSEERQARQLMEIYESLLI